MRNILVLFLTGFLSLAVISNTVINNKQKNPAVSEETKTKSANTYDLLEEYKKDASKRQPTYTGENITVSGVVVYKGPDIHGLPSLELSDKVNGTSHVLCVFDSADSLNKISKGDSLTISGKFHIVSSDDMIVLKQSKVQ